MTHITFTWFSIRKIIQDKISASIFFLRFAIILEVRPRAIRHLLANIVLKLAHDFCNIYWYLLVTTTIRLLLQATQVDNPDRRAGTILTVTRRGRSAAQLHFVKTAYNVSVPENIPPNSVITETIINRNIDEVLYTARTCSGDSGIVPVVVIEVLYTALTCSGDSGTVHCLCL